MKITRTITLSLEIEVSVEGDFYEGTPDRFFSNNGDVGNQGTPQRFEIWKIESNGVDITNVVPKSDMQLIEDQLLEQIIDEGIEDYSD